MIEILELGIKSWAEILTSADDHNKTAPLDLTWTGIKVGEREWSRINGCLFQYGDYI